jgi:hypothetical protein
MKNEIKTELQYLRTFRNLYIKYLRMIRYAIEHREGRSEDYDRYYVDKLIEKIRDLLDEHDNQSERQKVHIRQGDKRRFT